MRTWTSLGRVGVVEFFEMVDDDYPPNLSCSLVAALANDPSDYVYVVYNNNFVYNPGSSDSFFGKSMRLEMSPKGELVSCELFD